MQPSFFRPQRSLDPHSWTQMDQLTCYPVALGLSGVLQPGVCVASPQVSEALPALRTGAFPPEGWVTTTFKGASSCMREREAHAWHHRCPAHCSGHENYSWMLLAAWATGHPICGLCVGQSSYILFRLCSHAVRLPEVVLPEVEADTRQAVPPLRGRLATATASEQMEALVYKLSVEI